MVSAWKAAWLPKRLVIAPRVLPIEVRQLAEHESQGYSGIVLAWARRTCALARASGPLAA